VLYIMMGKSWSSKIEKAKKISRNQIEKYENIAKNLKINV